MKDLGKTKFCLGLQLEHTQEGILVHQYAYTKNVLERFHHENAHLECTLMMGRSLDIDKDPFRPREGGIVGIRISLLKCHSSINVSSKW
jgi:hypothetical protein